MVVVTPEALMARRDRLRPVLDSRAVIVVLDYSWDNVVAYVDRVLDQCAADTWDEIAAKLDHHFDWEYDDYHIVL